ncbi:MAG TPA: hypothetical protein VKN99_07585 [Polyangia bacterium]|nr:hypothetical protein [Polyangia bacterium]
MRPLALALTASLALHAAVLGAMSLVRGPEVKVEYEIDVVNAPPAPPDEHKGEPRPQRAAARARRVAAESATLLDRMPEPEVPDGGAAPLADLSPLAPASARLVVLLRTDRLRAGPLAEAARAAITALPDGALAASTGLDALDDFDALLVATANPLDVTQTFLVARTSDLSKVKAHFRAPGPPDPRVVLYPAGNVAVLGRPEHVQTITAGWLARMARFADDPSGDSLMEVTASGLHGALSVGGVRVALPKSGRARLSWPPVVRGRFEYEDAADAEALVASWPEMAGKIERAPLVRIAGLGGITTRAHLEQHAGVVTLEAPLHERHLEAIAGLLKLFLDVAQHRPGAQPPPVPLPRLKRTP